LATSAPYLAKERILSFFHSSLLYLF